MPIVIADYTFDGPFRSLSDLKDRSGLYAVLCRMDNGRYFLVDIGESEQLRSEFQNNEKKECWMSNCKGALKVAVLYTPEVDQEGRKDIERAIRSRDYVPCGTL